MDGYYIFYSCSVISFPFCVLHPFCPGETISPECHAPEISFSFSISTTLPFILPFFTFTLPFDPTHRNKPCYNPSSATLLFCLTFCPLCPCHLKPPPPSNRHGFPQGRSAGDTQRAGTHWGSSWALCTAESSSMQASGSLSLTST